jgi:type 1 glutamine amidotransferase
MPDELLFVTEVAPYRSSGQAPLAAGVHQHLGSAVVAMEQLARLVGLDFQHSASVATIEADQLDRARLLVLATIGDTPWATDQRAAIEERARRGSLGVVGIHSASDSASSWPLYGDLIGARFNGHPVTAELPVAVVEPNHPATAHLPAVWHFHDELYLFRDLAEVTPLLAVRMGPNASYATGEVMSDQDLPIAWCRQWEGTRTFYTALGHFVGAYEDVRYLRHLQGGIEWVLGVGPAGVGLAGVGLAGDLEP